MSIPRYGVLKAEPRDARRGHTHVHLRCSAGSTHCRVSVNVFSEQPPSELRYFALRTFVHPLTERLAQLRAGFTSIDSNENGLALDYVRQRLFDPNRMRLLPADRPGPNNDLADLIAVLIRDAEYLYAFGSRWGPERHTPDRVFGFTPGNGIHDVHMNQGNHPRFERDDGVWQDGALLVQRTQPAEQWSAVFLAFQSQAWRTDDRTGHAVRRSPITTDDRSR